MKYKVTFLGSDGTVVKDAAFKLLYGFPTLQEAEEDAKCFRATGKQAIIEVDDNGDLLPDRN
jgi:hypothetical protein